MWTFIIVIIGIVIGKFILDTTKQSYYIKQQGGILTKYATLVNYILHSNDKYRILQNDNTFVAIGTQGVAGSQVFYIYPSYGKVAIIMKVKNNPIFGNIKEEWTFPENMDQKDMIENIKKKLQYIYF